MAKIKKQKIIVREIPSKIKIIESSFQNKSNISDLPKKEETSLEEVVSEAPSSREFPESNRVADRIVQERANPETKREERYIPKDNIEEGENKRVYQSESSRSTREKSDNREFRNAEVDAVISRNDKYDVSPIDAKQATSKKKYPWEN